MISERTESLKYEWRSDIQWLGGDYSTPSLRLRQFPVRWKHHGRPRLALKQNAFERNIYLSFNGIEGGEGRGEICSRQWRISSSNINPLRLIGTVIFRTEAGQPRYLWNIDTRACGSVQAARSRGFSARKRTKKKEREREKKRRGKDARGKRSQRINGCLEASRRLAPAANTSRMNNSSTT